MLFDVIFTVVYSTPVISTFELGWLLLNVKPVYASYIQWSYVPVWDPSIGNFKIKPWYVPAKALLSLKLPDMVKDSLFLSSLKAEIVGR